MEQIYTNTADDVGSNDNGDEKKRKDSKKQNKDLDDNNENKQTSSQHQRRPNKNKNLSLGNITTDKSNFHRRGRSLATFGDFQGTSRVTTGKAKTSKDDSESTSGALENLRQMIASIKSMPAPPKSQKAEENPADLPSKHRRHESSTINTNKRPNPGGNKHKKNVSVSFYFPATGSASGSLKPIPDSDDGKPVDIEKSLQDTLSSLRRMSHDKGKTQKNTESKGKETENGKICHINKPNGDSNNLNFQF
jgi:hypothetical protein